MSRALINIDYTNDFVATDGKLTCGQPGQAIENSILALTKEFHQSNDLVVFAIDIHEENDSFHPETSLFPPHNIAGTTGRKLFNELEDFYQEIKESATTFYLDKTRYSAFCGTELNLILRSHQIDEVHLVGVCTDICILHTAIDAYNLGYKIVVHESAVASFNQVGHEWALSHFKSCLGATVID